MSTMKELAVTVHCDGARIMSSLSDGLGVTDRNVTALVDGLEREGLAERRIEW